MCVFCMAAALSPAWRWLGPASALIHHFQGIICDLVLAGEARQWFSCLVCAVYATEKFRPNQKL